MSETCSICKQPFREFVVGERVFVSMHPSRADCIAAVIRRCAEIAKEWRGPERKPNKSHVEASIMIESEIKSEFSEAFK
jgi:hypothetical protein